MLIIIVSFRFISSPSSFLSYFQATLLCTLVKLAFKNE
uniref:Uncharacterized protein n=1 Tax=Arundo donax TaxID=35708 RepID=A0A0A9CJ40_ARUDO